MIVFQQCKGFPRQIFTHSINQFAFDWENAALEQSFSDLLSRHIGLAVSNCKELGTIRNKSVFNRNRKLHDKLTPRKSPLIHLTVKIRSFQLPDDEVAQAGLFNVAAFALPGFKPATADEVKRRTRSRGFDPTTRFYAEDNGQVVGYCVLEPEQNRISHPWCKKGFESAAPELFESALKSARERGLAKVFTAYRRDWESVLRFFLDNGFAKSRDMVNFWTDPVDLPTRINRTRLPIDRLKRDDIPALAEMGRGVIRLPVEKLENYLFSNPYFPVEAYLVLRDRDGVSPVYRYWFGKRHVCRGEKNRSSRSLLPFGSIWHGRTQHETGERTLQLSGCRPGQCLDSRVGLTIRSQP